VDFFAEGVLLPYQVDYDTTHKKLCALRTEGVFMRSESSNKKPHRDQTEPKVPVVPIMPIVPDAPSASVPTLNPMRRLFASYMAADDVFDDFDFSPDTFALLHEPDMMGMMLADSLYDAGDVLLD
jgi:hypothetical protein